MNNIHQLHAMLIISVLSTFLFAEKLE